MAKKKKSLHAAENPDLQFINKVFDFAIQSAREECSNPNAAKIYDLAGSILKRRRVAVYNQLGEVRKRYGHLYADGEILNVWGNECSAMSHSIDGIDHLYYISLAIAIFMLDELKHSGKLLEAYRYFSEDQAALMSVSLPDIYDPCHEEIVLRGMMELIRERDPRDNRYQSFINDTSAQRTEPIIHQKPERDVNNLSPRERFNAVMAMIHPVVKERAVKRFEEKYWEFLNLFFECDAPFYTEWAEYKKESAANMAKCRVLGDKIMGPKKESSKSPTINSLLNKQAFQSANELPQMSEISILNKSPYIVIDDRDRLAAMAKHGLDIEKKARTVDQKRVAIMLFAHVVQMIPCEEAIENLGEELAEKFMSFEVNDPYETCFGYLCLIEAGSDIPWTYNPAVAVLMAAARKLPWNAYAIEQQEGLESAFDDDEDEDSDVFPEQLDECAEKDPEELKGLVPLDWNEKKAELYRLHYLSKPLYAPLDALSPNWKMNIPQLIFGLTGIIMPRTVSDNDGMAEEFAAAGVDVGISKCLELYLQLAMDIQYQSKDWRKDNSALHHTFSTEQCHSPESAAAESNDEETVEALKAQVKRLKESNTNYREALYQAQCEIDAVKDKAVKIETQASSERTELAALRELAFKQANAEGIKEPEIEDETEKLPYITKKRVVVFGGHDTWLKVIRPLLPNVTFISRDQRPNSDMIKAADVVWIQANALSHRSFYKIINVVRTNQVLIRYFGYASAMKCALQVLEDDA